MGNYGIVRTLRGHHIFVPTSDLSMPARLAVSGVWELQIERVLNRLLRPGDLAVEAGANVGYHTLHMAELVGPNGRVHTFEANPHLTPLLTSTLQFAELWSRVTLHPIAVSDRTGEVSFSFDPGYTGNGRLTAAGSATPRDQILQVPCVRLDDALAGSPPVDLLRMDIEGAEGLALAGAEALVARSPRLKIISEWAPGSLALRCDLDDLVRRLADWGFQAREIPMKGPLRPVELAALADPARFDLTDILFSRD